MDVELRAHARIVVERAERQAERRRAVEFAHDRQTRQKPRWVPGED